MPAERERTAKRYFGAELVLLQAPCAPVASLDTDSTLPRVAGRELSVEASQITGFAVTVAAVVACLINTSMDAGRQIA